MARNNETTTKFKVDISELKSAMQEARKQVAYANSEFKAVSSSLDNWSKSSDGLKAKLKQLNSNLESQENVLKEYEKTLEEIKKQYGENSNEAREYATKLNNQQSVVNKIKKEISGYEDALKEVSEAEKIASKTGKDVAEVLADVGNEAEDAGDGFTVLKGAMAEFIGNGLTALADGVKNAISSFMSLSDETREYREDLAKLETAFTTAGFTTEQATSVYKDFYAVLGEEDRSVEAVNHLAKLVDSEKDLQTWTDICTGVWATFGDSLPIEGLTEASNETAKTGKLTGVLADALNWAGENEEDFQAKLDSLNSEQERSAFITETLNGLYSDTADEYRKNNASVMEANKAQSDYADTMAKMGAIIEPVTTTLKVGFTELLNTALELFGGSVNIDAFTSKLKTGFGILTNTVLPAVKDGLGWIRDNKDIIIAGLAGIATGFVAFNVANMIMTATTAIKGFTSGLTLAEVAMKLFNLAVGANPIGLLITIILTVVTAIATFIATNDNARAKFLEIWGIVVEFFKNAISTIGKLFTETFPAFINKAIEYIKQLPEKVWTWLQNTIAKVTTWYTQMTNKARETGTAFLSKIIEFISQLPEKIWTQFTNAITKATQFASDMVNKAKETGTNFLNKLIEFVSQLPSKIWTQLVNTVSKATQFASDLGSKATEAGKGFVTNLVNAVSGIVGKMQSIGSDIVNGIWSGISSGWSWLTDNVSNLATSLFETAKKVLDINSPSKVFADEVGKWIPAGIAVGIDKNAKTAINSVKNLAMDTVGGARAGLSNATTSLGGTGSVVNNFTQVINSPKELSRLEIYRQSKNLLGYAGGGV